MAKRATECGIDVNTISVIIFSYKKDYIEAMAYGAWPHGGFGVGLERVVMLYCDLRNIRNTSLFPRDPKRLLPWKNIFIEFNLSIINVINIILIVIIN